MVTEPTKRQNGRRAASTVAVASHGRSEKENGARAARDDSHDALWHDELFLSQASILLTEQLDDRALIEQTIHLPLPYLADWCAMHLVTADTDSDTLPMIECAHIDPGQEARARTVWQQSVREAPWTIPALAHLVRTGERPTAPTVVDVALEPPTSYSHSLLAARLVARVGLATALHVPLATNARTMGILTLGSISPGRYGPRQVALALAYASRVAALLDRAFKYRHTVKTLAARNLALAVVVHDLKTSVAQVAQNAETVQARFAVQWAPQFDSYVADALTQIKTTAHSLRAMLDDLGTETNREAGASPPLKRQATDLLALVRQTVESYARPAESYSLQIESGNLDRLVGYWDPEALKRVLDNVLSNAITYSRFGSTITLRVWHGEMRARPGGQRREWAYVQIRDQGVGIPACDLPHIFEPFYRGSNVKDTVAGMGIGLTSVQSLVQRHGGNVRIASELGEGTTLTVALPLERVPQGPQWRRNLERGEGVGRRAKGMRYEEA